MEPNAQGELAPTQTADEDKSGIQKRIDELVAKQHQLSSERDSYAQANSQLTQTVAQLMARMDSVQTQNNEPPVEVTDDERKKFDAYAGGTLKRMEQTLAQLQQQMAISNVDPLASKYNVPPEVAARAKELIRAQRVPEQTAITFAIGEAAMSGKWNNDVRAHNNGIAGQSLPSGGVPKGNIQPQTGPAAYPNDFNTWPPGRQMAWINKNRPDIHDQPL